MREVIWRPRAVADLDSILVYITLELCSPDAAEASANAIFSAIERVAAFPESGRAIVDEDLKRTYRRVLAKSYWIYYSFDDSALTVWRIFHVTQDYDGYGFEMLDG